MAETIISPGVFQRENDISFITPAPVEAGAAIIGPTVKGPVEVPTVVTSYNDYARKFGVTFQSGSNTHEFLTSLAVKSYFEQGGNSCLVTRVVNGSFESATSTNIQANGKESGTLTTSTLNNISADFISSTDNTGLVVVPTTSGTGTGAAFTVNTTSGSASTSITVTSAGSGYQVGDTLTFASASLDTSDDVVATLVADDIVDSVNPFTIKTLGKGAIYNNDGTANSDGSLPSGTADNIRFEISNVDSTKGTFTLSIRRGDDSTKNKIVLETFNNLSLDPNADNYIEKVIGNQEIAKTTDSDGVVFIGTTGEYVNKSKYIRIASVNLPTLNYLGTDGVTIGTDSDGDSYSQSLPVAQTGAFSGATGTVANGALLFDSIDTVSQGIAASDYADAITILENQDEFLFNVITTPGLTYDKHSSTLDSVISLAETRGDCIAVVDLYTYGATVGNVTGKAALLNSSYAASYWPWLQTASANGKNVWIPASTVIPGIYAFTDGASAPWYAPAGLVRGGIPGVIQAERKLTRNDRDTLYNGKVNPIATFPGSGIAVFGQKTLQTKASALDRVNVRRLLIDLKKFIGDQAQNLVFEQNTISTRNKFLSTVNPYLDSVVQRNGLYAYRVVMDDTNNTAEVVDRNQLVGQIFIQPAKTAEFIVLDFVVEPTGATFGA